jgi:hypothetical protein
MMSRERAERLAQRARRRPPAAGGMVGCLHEPGKHARGLRDEVLDPSRSGPGARLAHRLEVQGKTPARAGNPHPFSRLHGVPRRDIRTSLASILVDEVGAA